MHYTPTDERVWQQQAANGLLSLLKTASDNELPVIPWTVGPGRLLFARIDAPEGRRQLFELWAAALHLTDRRETAPGDRITLTASGELGGITVRIITDIWTEDEQRA
ncbi:hypothetical protein KV557_24655 [Kitasatospora aureofaciens]|uniref:hypothetical protein n=1 Tax=Kitasatospora aureofaciens TaxID=1894 RepID=UPI001C462668|nr:hypothetical protein [Kitasatospora aureofaciens]MBV6700256.1 hypothetical protein [Kitasatospora aureofaciens]